MNTDISVSRCDDGTWCWAFTIDGETYADGCEEATKTDAVRKARAARQEWEDKNI